MCTNIQHIKTGARCGLTQERRTPRTVSDDKVFGSELRALVVEQRLPVEADHHGALGHVQQASHHVSLLPGTAQRLAPLVVPLGLEVRASPLPARNTLYVHQGHAMFSYFLLLQPEEDVLLSFFVCFCRILYIQH